MQITATLVLVAAAVAGLLGGWGGYRIGVSGCADARIEHAAQLRDQGIAYAQAWQSALADAGRAAKAESRRAATAAQARGRASDLSQGVKSEIASDLDRACEWRDAHRLRITALYAAYGYPASTTSDGVRPALPGAASTDATARAVGSLGLQLGGGVRGLAPGLRGGAD